MAKMRNLSIAIAGVACVAIGSAGAPNTAQAAIITNNFRVDNITEGALANQTFFGSFTYDDTALSDPNILTAPDTGNPIINPSNGLSNVSFNFLGINYTQQNDGDFPNSPYLEFQNGLFLGLSFIVSENSAAFSNPTVIPGPIRAFGTLGPDFLTLVDGKSDPDSIGTVTYGVQAVPTPALLPGLVGLGVGILRKRRAEAKERAVES